MWTGSSSDVVAEVVGLAEHEARLDAAARHPHGEAARMVVAPVIGVGQLALAVDGAPELAAPDHQRIVEQPALLQVLNQRGGGLIHALGLQREVARQVVVLVPAAVIELDEAHVRVRPAAAPAGNWRHRFRACGNPAHTAQRLIPAPSTGPSVRAPKSASGRPFHIARCAFRFPDRRIFPSAARFNLATPSSMRRRVVGLMPGGLER